MNIWLIEIGETLPLQPGVRKMRTGLLADKLIERGHNVRWWVSAFEHQSKLMLFKQDQEVPLSSGLTLQILRGCGYSSNISLARYVDHRLIARKFRKIAPNLDPPDIIVAALPCYHLAFEAVRFARSFNIPILVDILDPWPDLLLTKFNNRFSHQLVKLSLTFDYNRLHALLREADGLIAVSNGYLNWGLDKAKRLAGKRDRVFLLGYRTHQKSSTSSKAVILPEWLRGNEHKKLLLFIGTFGFSYEMPLLVEAARRMESLATKDVCFVFAGTGEQAEFVRQKSAGLSNVILPGWLDAPAIGSLLSHGYLGLAPYKCGQCEEGRLPYKPFEYLSAGLPLISSLEGEMADLIKNHGLGLSYRPGDLEGLCKAIGALLQNNDMRNMMSANAMAFFKEHGDADVIYDEYGRHIEKVIEIE